MNIDPIRGTYGDDKQIKFFLLGFLCGWNGIQCQNLNNF